MQIRTIRFLIPSRVRWVAGCGLLLASLGGTPASGFWGNQPTGNQCGAGQGTSDCMEHLRTGYHANALWPYPYVCADRVWAREPFEIMTANGWRQQNLLGGHYFDPETGKLTRAGELKVYWILTQSPPNRRQIFVEQSMDAAVTQDRIAQAQSYASSLPVDSASALVQQTVVPSPARPASMVDAERNSFIQSRLPAVLPANTTTTSSSSN
ncbi:hypothetical protein [Aeoliella sp. SH292]|uniref:hypothetical protein n=1 Tax=Aeoliella sp. SH292 TaxID=3454464 RepID=UPI003F9899ED